MSMELGVYQNPALSQQLNLAPQLLQWLRLLQVPTTELSAMVRQELETNPALELDDAQPDLDAKEPDSDLLPAEDQGPDAAEDLAARLDMLAELDSEWRRDYVQSKAQAGSTPQDEQEKHQFILDCLADRTSLQEHLLMQLTASSLSESGRALALLMIGSLDERGYLSTPVADLSGMLGVTLEEAEAVLKTLQDMDPPGVGARDVRECLLLQLRAMGKHDSTAYHIMDRHADLVEQGRFDEIARNLRLSPEAVTAARKELALLNPSPGSVFTARPVQYVEPDVTVTRKGPDYAIELNDEGLPHLRLSAACRQLLAEKKLHGEDLAYLRRKIRTATFLIQGIGQRQETLRKVALEIVRVQRDYLDDESGELKPLTMVKVAGVLGVHETTVSRAIANKYIATPRGLFEMKHFFRAGYQCNDGSTLTPDSVKDLIENLIKEENKAEPLTDITIVDMLQRKGLKLARRTVAKYRDELGLAASKDRVSRRGARPLPTIAVPTPVETIEACAAAM